MLIADTRPSKSEGVTIWRSVVVPIVHRIGPTPIRKKLSPASAGVGIQIVDTITSAAASPASGPIDDHHAERQRADEPAGQQRAHDHPDAVDGQRDAHAGGGEAEPVDRVGHVHRLQHEERGVEHELGDQDRQQQPVAEHEARALAEILQRVARRAPARAAAPAGRRAGTPRRSRARPRRRRRRPRRSSPRARRPAPGRPRRPPCAPARAARSRRRARPAAPGPARARARPRCRPPSRTRPRRPAARAAPGSAGRIAPARAWPRARGARTASAAAMRRRRGMRSASTPAGMARSRNGSVAAVWRKPVSPAPAPSASTATSGAAARPICSADCAARFDHARRGKPDPVFT